MNNLLTASRQSKLLSCPRAHYWRYEVGLQTIDSGLALRFGSAWHAATEARWKGATFEQALAAALPEAELDEYTVATLSGLLMGYYAHYKDETLIKTVHPEVEFRNKLDGSRTFEEAGKIDGLVELFDGRPGMLESKTTSDSVSPESDYWLRLRFNSQLFQYVIAARKLGWDIQIVIYDVVRKPAIQPKQIPVLDENGLKIVTDVEGNRVFNKNGKPRESASSADGWTLKSRIETPDEFNTRLFNDTQARPDFYFARREVPILESDLEEFEAQRLTLSRMILGCRQLEKRASKPERAWPRNVGENSCNYCEFQSFCLQNLSIDLINPPAGFQVGEASPELSK